MPDEKNKKSNEIPIVAENPINVLADLVDKTRIALSEPAEALSASMSSLTKLADPGYDLVAEILKTGKQYPNMPTGGSMRVPIRGSGSVLDYDDYDRNQTYFPIAAGSGIRMPGSFESGLTKKEIEEIIDKKLPTKKDDSMKKDDIITLIKEIRENETNQENEKILAVNKIGLDFITKELLDGKERAWHCGKCRAPLVIFKGEEGIEEIKNCLRNFQNNVPKKCKNGHPNWFEIKEDGIVWQVKIAFEREFDRKKG